MMIEAHICVGYDEIKDLEEVLRFIQVIREERRKAESGEVKPEIDRTSPLVKAMDAPGPDIKKPRRKKPEAEPVAEQVTKERLQELFRAYAPTHVERAKSLLNQFGVNRLGELPESRYAEFAVALQQ